MSETKFEVGDSVSWMGATGTVEEIGKDKSLLVYFPTDDCRHEFYPDGRSHSFHVEPSLKLIHKAKKKITVECWVNLIGDGATGAYCSRYFADTDAEILRHRYPDVTTVHLSKEIEV